MIAQVSMGIMIYSHSAYTMGIIVPKLIIYQQTTYGFSESNVLQLQLSYLMAEL